jgi:hypothetical protein
MGKGKDFMGKGKGGAVTQKDASELPYTGSVYSAAYASI